MPAISTSWLNSRVAPLANDRPAGRGIHRSSQSSGLTTARSIRTVSLTPGAEGPGRGPSGLDVRTHLPPSASGCADESSLGKPDAVSFRTDGKYRHSWSPQCCCASMNHGNRPAARRRRTNHRQPRPPAGGWGGNRLRRRDDRCRLRLRRRTGRSAAPTWAADVARRRSLHVHGRHGTAACSKEPSRPLADPQHRRTAGRGRPRLWSDCRGAKLWRPLALSSAAAIGASPRSRCRGGQP
jgi:hypothetical protein